MFKVSMVKLRAQAMLMAGLACAWMMPAVTGVADDGEQSVYGSPERALTALQEAVRAGDTNALRRIFGPALSEITNPDPVERANNFAAFAKRLAESTELAKQTNGTVVLRLGNEHWPFPIPLAKKDDKWFFDTSAGKEEILNRRIGQNELSGIEVCQAYVQAQREYAMKDRAGNGIIEYAQKMRSTPGKKDGLFWEAKPDEERSPFGPLVAKAHQEGYGRTNDTASAQKPHNPFHGYFFRILTKQGENAPGGKYDYIVNGHMVAGFAFLAYPAQWGNSGVMTFIVNHHGKIYQKNLGENTTELAKEIEEYNPDETWTLVESVSAAGEPSPAPQTVSSIQAPPQVDQSDLKAVTDGNMAFAIDLYGKLRSQEGNLFFSPYSISTALAMTYGGARGETEKQMAKTLHFDLPSDKLHPAFAALEANLDAVQQKGEVKLAVANSLWPQQGFAFLPDYLALCQRNYGTTITPVDYKEATEAARKTINDWVERKTNKKIVELLKPGVLDSLTRLVLANAIYFKGNWANQFDDKLTTDEPFHVSARTTVKAPLMHQKKVFGYAESPDLQVLELPYAGNDLSMLVLLPRKVDGVGDLGAEADDAELGRMDNKLGEKGSGCLLSEVQDQLGVLIGGNLGRAGNEGRVCCPTGGFLRHGWQEGSIH